MSAKLGFTAGLAVGLLAGSRAGRGLYDRSAATATAVVNDPRVRRGASTALHRAGAAGSSVAGAASRKITQRGRGEGDEGNGRQGGDGRGDGAEAAESADGAGPGDGRASGGDRRLGAAHRGRGLTGHSAGGWRRRGRGRGREKGYGTAHLGRGGGESGGVRADGFPHRAWHYRHAEADGMSPGPEAARGVDGHPGISAPSAQEAGRMSGEGGGSGSGSASGSGSGSGKRGSSGRSGRSSRSNK